jgi:hypothetical protein
MKPRILFTLVLAMAALPLGAGEPLSIRVSPSISMEPANLRVSATVEANDANRAIQVTAESPNFYRSSESPLDGGRSPRITTIEFRNLPGGSIRISVALKDGSGRTRASAFSHVTILATGKRER